MNPKAKKLTTGVLAMTAVGPTIPTPIRAILLSLAVVFSVAVAFTIEMLQVYLPLHVSDIMDVLWCALGATAGVGITVGITSASGSKTSNGHNSPPTFS